MFKISVNSVDEAKLSPAAKEWLEKLNKMVNKSETLKQSYIDLSIYGQTYVDMKKVMQEITKED